MSSSTTEPFTTAVLTISDSCARGERQDLSGPAVAKTIQKYNFTISAQQIVGDEQRAIEQKLIALSASRPRFAAAIVTVKSATTQSISVFPESPSRPVG